MPARNRRWLAVLLVTAAVIAAFEIGRRSISTDPPPLVVYCAHDAEFADEILRDFERETGRRVGVKVAGGVRQSKQAIQYLVLLYETLGPDWMTPDRFRIGASTLLNDVLMQLGKERTGAYQGPDYFTLD